MIEAVNSTIQGILSITWPMLVISSVVLISFRICFLTKNQEKLIIYKELLMYAFIIYTLCLFQIVTFQETVEWSTNNFIPFKEILRYNMGSRLFFKNVIGNIALFLPYGFFTSFYLKNEKANLTLILTLIISFSIEIVQLSIGRVFDIDDILLNVVGGYVGYLIYAYGKRIWDKLPDVLKSDIALNILSIIVLVIIITLI